MLNNDLAIAIAIVNFKGNVPLLLPVLRPQCQNLDLLQTFAAVQNLSQDRRYAAGFAQELVAHPTPTSYTPQRLPRRLYDGIREWLLNLSVEVWYFFTTWRSKLAPPVPSAISEIEAPAPSPVSDDSKRKPTMPIILSTAVRTAACGYRMELIVECDGAGRVLDSLGIDRGACPYCGVNSKL
jgi:hypothetical protein